MVCRDCCAPCEEAPCGRCFSCCPGAAEGCPHNAAPERAAGEAPQSSQACSYCGWGPYYGWGVSGCCPNCGAA
jgi:hypothetical protein